MEPHGVHPCIWLIHKKQVSVSSDTSGSTAEAVSVSLFVDRLFISVLAVVNETIYIVSVCSLLRW